MQTDDEAADYNNFKSEFKFLLGDKNFSESVDSSAFKTAFYNLLKNNNAGGYIFARFGGWQSTVVLGAGWYDYFCGFAIKYTTGVYLVSINNGTVKVSKKFDFIL